MTNWKKFNEVIATNDLYRVDDENGKLIMVAPLRTIYWSLNLKEEAVIRIASETEGEEANGICEINFNGRNPYWKLVLVTKFDDCEID